MRVKQFAAEALKNLEIQKSLEIPTMREFLIDSWQNVLHPSEVLELEGAWYIDLICEWLTVLSVCTLITLENYAVADRLLEPYGLDHTTFPEELKGTKQLLINISPRCSKSTIVTTCWPTWEWLFMPWLTYMCLSYDQSLATDHNDDRRKIIKSDWYQGMAGGMKLSSSKNRLTEFQNSAQGQMVARGFNAGVTGGGGMRLIVDDGNDPNKVESDAFREAANRSFNDYSITRRNNPKLAAVVNVQQRTHDRDISGTVLDEPEGWTIVVISMEAEQHEQINFPLSKRVINRSPGDLMHPDRFSPEICKAIKRKSAQLWAGRYQQRPSVMGGGMFKFSHWRLYADYPTEIDRTIISIDCSFKGEPDSDFVVIGVIGQVLNVRTTLDEDGTVKSEHEYYVPYRWRGQAGYTDTENALIDTAKRFPQAITKLVEDKANGSAIIDRLSRVMHGIEPYNPGRDNKISRAAATQPVQQRGDILLPIAPWAVEALRATGRNTMTLGEWWELYPPTHQSTAEHAPVEGWVIELLDELALFPHGSNDDQVDMITQGVNWLESQPEVTVWSGFSSTAGPSRF